MFDTITASKGTSNDPDAADDARKTEISYCTRIGRYNPNTSRPISVTFKRREDKEQLLTNKKNLPPGLYVNKEYPIQIKKARGCLRGVFRMVKANPRYKDKWKLQGDKLIIDGLKYTMENLGELPLELAAYRAAEKCNDNT